MYEGGGLPRTDVGWTAAGDAAGEATGADDAIACAFLLFFGGEIIVLKNWEGLFSNPLVLPTDIAKSLLSDWNVGGLADTYVGDCEFSFLALWWIDGTWELGGGLAPTYTGAAGVGGLMLLLKYSDGSSPIPFDRNIIYSKTLQLPFFLCSVFSCFSW